MTGSRRGPVDVLVVGGGTSGCVLAARLSEDPARSVLLLEEGPDHTSYDHTVTSPGHALIVSRRREFAQGLKLDVDGRPVPLARGRVLGGTSAVNYLATVRGHPGDYDRWAARGNPGWAWPDVLPFFRKAERDLDFPESALHGHHGPLTVARWSERTFAAPHTAFQHGLTEVGVAAAADLNDASLLPGVGPFPASVRPGTRSRLTVSQAYLTDEVRARPNLEVRTGTRAVRLRLCQGRVLGVRTATGERVDAGEVVVACGAVQSPALLLRSGLGPAEDLRACGIAPECDLPGVGHGLQDHLGPALNYRIDDRIDAARRPGGGAHQAGRDEGGPAQTVWVAASGSGPEPDVHVFPVLLPGKDGAVAAESFAVLVFSLRPDRRGRVLLHPGEPDRNPIIRLPAPGDREIAATQKIFEVLQDWEESAVCRELGVRRAPGETRLSAPGAAAAAVRGALVSYAHLTGSCAMGPEGEPGAVLDPACRVRGVQGLRVVDASAMPDIPSGNTYLSCVMMAERVADLMS